MLIVNLNALQTVYVLYFVNQMFSESQHEPRRSTQNVRAALRSTVGYHAYRTFLTRIAVLNTPSWRPFRNRHLLIGSLPSAGATTGIRLFGLVVSLPKATIPSDVGQDCRQSFWTAGFEQVGNARQTAGDVLATAGLPAEYARGRHQSFDLSATVAVAGRMASPGRKYCAGILRYAGHQ